MSEKRFVYAAEYFPMVLQKIKDNSTDKTYDLEDVCELLNEQQSTIEAKDKEIAELDQQCADFLGARIKAQEEWEKCTDKLKEKIVEQQSTINRLQKHLDYEMEEHTEKIFEMFEFMEEKGVFGEYYGKVKKEVLDDE